jgi:WD40 repeat protein
LCKISVYDFRKFKKIDEPFFHGDIWTDNGKVKDIDIKLPPANPYGFTFSPDGKILAVGAGPIRLYDTETWQEVKTLPNEVNLFTVHGGLDFSPDGKILASISGDFWGGKRPVVLLWDWEKGEILKELDCAGMSLPCTVRFSPGGRYIACGGESFRRPPPMAAPKMIEILEVSTGREVRSFPGGQLFEGIVTGIDFSHDGRLLAWVGSGGVSVGFSVEDISDIAGPEASVRPEHKVITTWGRIKFQRR